MKHQKWIVLSAWALLSLPVSAQFNIKVGYNIGLVDAPLHNELLRLHNEKAESYVTPFDRLNSLHGLELGFRHRWSAVSVEVGWQMKRNRLVAEGELSPGGTTYQNVIVYGTHAATAGLYSHFGPMSLGTTIDYNRLKIKSIFEEPEYEMVMHDNAWSSTFSMSFAISGNGAVSLSLRPFFQWYWTPYDLDVLHKALNLPLGNASERLKVYGVSIVVFNGKQ